LTNYTLQGINGPCRLTPSERLASFFERLGAQPPAATHDEAFRLVADTLNAVEDEFSGAAYDPEKHLSDGRMYPPQEDSRRLVEGRKDVVRYRSRGHNTWISETWISENGAIRIEKIGSKGTACGVLLG